MDKINKTEILKAIEKKNIDIIKYHNIIESNNLKLTTLLHSIKYNIELLLSNSKDLYDNVIGEQYRLIYEKLIYRNSYSLTDEKTTVKKDDVFKLMELIECINNHEQNKKRFYDEFNKIFEKNEDHDNSELKIYENGLRFESYRSDYGLNVANAIDEFFKEKEYEQE